MIETRDPDYEIDIEVVSDENDCGNVDDGVRMTEESGNAIELEDVHTTKSVGSGQRDLHSTDMQVDNRPQPSIQARPAADISPGIHSSMFSNNSVESSLADGEDLLDVIGLRKRECVPQAEARGEEANLDPSVTSVQLLARVLATRKHLDLTNKVVVDYTAPNLRLGGNADVYQGLLVEGNGKVAVKCIRIHYDHEGKNAKHIANEIRIWSDLVHPNIMPLRGYCIDRGYPNLISDWMERGSLRDFMKRLDKRETVEMVLGIARGLAYIHSKSAVHSDVKSDNILISPDKQPLLTDFGLSRMDNISAGYTTHLSRGTTRWQAIEFFQITEDSSPNHTDKTDVWAFGMTVYELLTHKIPFYHIKNETYVMFQILGGSKPTEPSELLVDSQIDRFLWSICLKCWEKDPGLRPSMNELEDEVERFVELQRRQPLNVV